MGSLKAATAFKGVTELESPDGVRDGKICQDGTVQLSTIVEDMSLAMPERQDAPEADARDQDSPDKWVKRHKDMVRLTGRHPFNSEPPLKALQAAGWVTPPALHVVRNHGAVPKLDFDTHTLSIEGFPQGPKELNMEELTSGSYGSLASIPVSFICAGNRRKEQNMTKKTIGFNWGCAAVGNSVWTGVRLCELLACLGVTKPTKEYRYVHFEGPQGELPQGSTGSYGTSLDLGWALDRERDVLLAFKQNGERLTPDHGAPLRTLLPGCIGGRMIKWLCRMKISSEPSENHYHYFDNRVLPPHVDAELATKEGWWYKPDYIINHININSAMFEPRHSSYFRIGADAPRTMKVAGYAYVGGGLKIIRAEVSTDGGRSWELTELTRPEDEIAAARGTDKHWCWSWWETEVATERLQSCEEILCRAVDSNQNMQPANLTWNVMGMMNNCLFRVKVHRLSDPKFGPALWFEHPTMPGNEKGGWMTEDAGTFDPEMAVECAPGATGTPPNRPVAAVWETKPAGTEEAAGAVKRTEAGKLVKSCKEWLEQGISMEEVQKHNDEKASWIVVKDRVYDATPYLEDHPGGASSILMVAGQEATEDFEAVHSKKAWDMLEDYYIGPLRKAGAASSSSQPGSPGLLGSLVRLLNPIGWIRMLAPAPVVPFLDPKKVQRVPLAEKIVVSHDTRIFRFALPSKSMRLGLPTGMHIFLRAKINGSLVMRPYTPLTDDSTLGHVDFLVKVYFKGVHPKFPDGGAMSQHLESLEIGDTIDVKGPLGEIVYGGQGVFTHTGREHRVKRISLIAGGTGLTPCYQVASAILRDPTDETEVRLLYANQSPDDILAQEQLELMAKEHADRFKIWYTVDRMPEGKEWGYSKGFINEDMIRDHLFAPDKDTVTFMCGPPPMLQYACLPNLKKLGHAEESVFTF